MRWHVGKSSTNQLDSNIRSGLNKDDGERQGGGGTKRGSAGYSFRDITTKAIFQDTYLETTSFHISLIRHG